MNTSISSLFIKGLCNSSNSLLFYNSTSLKETDMNDGFRIGDILINKDGSPWIIEDIYKPYNETFYRLKNFYNDSITMSVNDLSKFRLISCLKETKMSEFFNVGDKIRFDKAVAAVNHGGLSYTIAHFDLCEHITLKELPNMKFHKSLFQHIYKPCDVLLSPYNNCRYFIKTIEYSLIDGLPIYALHCVHSPTIFMKLNDLTNWKLEPFSPVFKSGSFILYKDIVYKTFHDSFRMMHGEEMVEFINLYLWQGEFYCFDKAVNVKDCQEMIPVSKS